MFGPSLKHRHFQENWNLLGKHSHWLLSAGRSNLNASSVVSHFLLKSHPISRRKSGIEVSKLEVTLISKATYWLGKRMGLDTYEEPFPHHYRDPAEKDVCIGYTTTDHVVQPRDEILAKLHISRHFWVFQQILEFNKY